MQEGSLRCDVNLSVRKKGESALGTRTEMKNLNSFRFIQSAIQYEFQRQVEAVEAGEAIVQETRRYDQASARPSPCAARRTPTTTATSPTRICRPLSPPKRRWKSPRLYPPAARPAQEPVHPGVRSQPQDADLLVNDLETADYF